jgi:hypothetical protein
MGFSSCEEGAIVIDDDTVTEIVEYALGWNQSTENLNEIPSDINLGIGNGTLPSSVDLREHFPPIGNQGNYGTCVAWAVGYNPENCSRSNGQRL